jgi:hypothetical protein
LGKRGEPLAAAEQGTSKSADLLSALPSGHTAAAARILSKYDVTDISPTEYSEMVQKLYQAGVVSEGEFQELAAVRVDLDAEDIEPDESVDLLEFYAALLRRARRKFAGADGAPQLSQHLQPLLRRLDWLEKFAVIQSAPDAAGLSRLA